MPQYVEHTVDFERVASLPRRELSAQDAEIWSDVLTRQLIVPGAKGRLRPWQALSLAEAAHNRGAWLALPVGQGKTLIAELLPVVMQARRPLLIIPAALRDKTFADRRDLRGAWRLFTGPYPVLSREELALEKNARRLEYMQPDLIVIDEGDELANLESSAVRRIDRYVVARGDAVRVVVMTGTPSRNSIMGYWHLLCWALRERAPVPLRESEARKWAGALDNKGPRGQRPCQVRPGPLGHDTDSARAWFAERLRQTPGVVIVDEDSAGDVPLIVRHRIARECPELDRHFQRLLLENENPDGHPVSDGLSLWRIDGQLGCGLFTRWNPPPPKEWRDARVTFARFVRSSIEASQRSGRPLDTEAQVVRRYPDEPEVVNWQEVRDTYDPEANSESVWVSGATLQSAIDWIGESPEPGIVWCGSVEFARALSAATGLPYYAREGKDQRGRGLHAAPVENIIVSWHANKKGFNLQPWTRKLLVMPPQSAKWLEQIFGRSHRAGQTQAVTVDVLVTSGGTIDAFQSALYEARFSAATVSLRQKLIRARIERVRPRITASNRYRWATRS